MQEQRGRRARVRPQVQLVEPARRPPDRRQGEWLQTAGLWLLAVLACAVVGYCAIRWRLDLAFVIATPFGL